jgi:TetR/AcrR family transcriptional regulator, tetracycline repressor protein
MTRSARTHSLTREEIVEAALRLLRRDGLSKLTMRAVASEMGVTPMAVYHYIDSKEDLLRLAYAEISAPWGQAPLLLAGQDWEDSLRSFLMSIWEGLAQYPGLGAYLIELPNINVTPQGLALGIRFFEDAGFPPVQARLAWSFALTYIHGRISVDAHLGHKPEAPRLEGLRAHDYVTFGVEGVILGLRAIQEGADVVLTTRTRRSRG